MDTFEFLTLQIEGGVATVKLNRPEVYNALNDGLTFELQNALKVCTKDDQVRVVVLTGEGKAFCSGQDLKDSAADPDRSFMASLHKRYNPIIRAMRTMPKPIICSLNGVAAGAGASLALASDYIIASENASLIEVFINIGLVPDSGSSYFLPRLVGSQKAFELATMGTKVGAVQAVELGLVNKAVAHSELESETALVADYYKQAPTKAIGLIKKMLNKSTTSTLDEMLEYEAYCQEIAGRSDDHKEGVQAFIQKRTAEFKGK